MNTIDIILGIFLLMGLVRGFFKGFFMELAGIVALVAGIYIAIHFSDLAYAFLASFISWEKQYLALAAFAVTFFVIILIISLAGRILTKMVNIIALGIVNRIFGAVFGMLKMAFLASVFFMLLNQVETFSIDGETTEGSVLYAPVKGLAPLVLPTIIQEIQENGFFEPPSEENK